MTPSLINHIRKFIVLPDEAADGIASRFQNLKVAKKTDLMKERTLCRSLFFVEKGCLRLYFQKANGNEQTTQFALEGWWLTDFHAFHSQQPATFSVQTVETSEILAIGYHELEKLLQEFPILEKYFRIIYQRFTSASQKRLRLLYEHSREELYHNFVSSFPEFVQRIPQYLLASFLGVTPEYLSEIRKKYVSTQEKKP